MAEISDKNNSEIMKKTIVTAIIGYGMGGSVFHAPVISSTDGFKISKIFTRDPLHAAKAKERYPGTEIVEDTDKIFSDPEIELVVIVTPNQYHHPLALKALNAGKNVITDKPFTVAVSQADELISLASEKNLMLSVFHNRRWDADFRTVKKLIEKNVLGHISECEIHYGRYRNYFKNNWKEADLPGSGLVYDIGSHLIDQALSLFGDPDYVWADLRKQRKGSRI
ncbi:MAG: Gfo/Idh/MocA family oxidoreductase, partial [Eubacteriales bacterium]|nr:Gfo/Idh/MocA family oxidoreductase [Eubacteriales bacterium]